MKLLLALILTLSLTACADPKYLNPAPTIQNSASAENCAQKWDSQKLCITIDWTVGPKRMAMSEAVVTFRNFEGQLQDPSAAPQFFILMPAHGHGSDDPIQVQRVEKGLYKLTEIGFSMKGFWEFHIGVEGSDDHIIPYTLP